MRGYQGSPDTATGGVRRNARETLGERRVRFCRRAGRGAGRGPGGPPHTGVSVLGISVVLQNFVLEFAVGMEGCQGAVGVAAVAGFVAVEQGENFGVVGERPEGEIEARVAVDAVVVLLHFVLLVDHFDVERGGLDREDAFEAPASGDQLLDQAEFDLVAGFEGGQVGVAHRLEFLFGFIGEDEIAGVEAMRDGVCGRAGDSFRGLAAFGEGSVGARGALLSFGRHRFPPVAVYAQACESPGCAKHN